MRTVRTAARALLLHEDRLLTVRMRGDKQDFLVLPGGGQRHGETLTDTVQREVREEVGGRIELGRVLYVREYIGRNHALARQHKTFHQLEVVFRGKILNPDEVCAGPECDHRQVDICWLPLSDLAEAPLHPAILKEILLNGDECAEPVYLGDIF